MPAQRCAPRLAKAALPYALLAVMGSASLWAAAAPVACEVRSSPQQTPVIELYTSEGCSSCPPADQWLSSLRGKPVVAMAFHVAYWDYIGWKDRFAQSDFTARQREIARLNGLGGIYTPQLVRNGRDWHDYRQVMQPAAPAGANMVLQRVGETDRFEALVEPANAHGTWTAYWTVTEDGHSSQVRSGENAGEFLKHDFVVRQYAAAGRYQGPQKLSFFALAAQADHPRAVNLVVTDAQSQLPLQAVRLACP